MYLPTDGKGRPKLLFLSQTLPFPPDGGVKIRTYNVLRLLARTFDVTALCFYRRRQHRDVHGAVEALRAFAEVEAFPIPQEHSLTRLVWDHARSTITGRAYTVFSYESAAFRRRLEVVLATRRFDLVHADSMDLSGYFPLLRNLPVVCVHHDAQSVLLRRRASRERNLLARAYLNYQARLMGREEARCCPRVALNVTVSPVDRSELLCQAPDARFIVVPNGVDIEGFRPEHGADVGLVFVGGATWLPNADAMEYFCSHILPNVRASGFDGPVRWLGRVPERTRRRYRRTYGVEATGYVEDIRPIVHDAACYIVPIRIGGGTRIKILDAWAMGKAVVSTSIGCEGLAAVDGRNILIRDDPTDFAAAVTQLLADEGLRRRLGAEGRLTAERVYDWEVIGSGMTEAYVGLIRAAATPHCRPHTVA
jgi:glycosyltransferase involved in cell wall biosynthesis